MPSSTAHTTPLESVHLTRSPAVRRVLWQVLLLNALVVAVKLAIGIRTGSLTVLGAALESGLDMLNNVLGMVLVSIAARAPDEDHPYGHDKFETLGTLGIVGFLSISCFELLREGVASFLGHNRPARGNALDIAIVLGTLLVNAFVVWFERRRGRALSSAFLLADAEHTRSDILVTVIALASLALARAGLTRADAVLAMAVALIIARSGYGILRESIPILVDQRALNAAELRRVLRDIPEIADVREVRSRFTASGALFAEVTIGIAGSTTVDHAHALADQVEEAIARRYGPGAVTVHIEPV
ncbi:MAG TPA: cation diffusion facilitator family transporter [Gemmatimonadaceae bacterium]|nr:cation diffusion facilitator family transporter [Gemmatimonadaceae bacterium]